MIDIWFLFGFSVGESHSENQSLYLGMIKLSCDFQNTPEKQNFQL